MANWFKEAAKHVGRFASDVFDVVNEGTNGAFNSMTGITANEIATQNLEYQQEYNQQIMDREDTAYQRLVEDLTEAGLNPAFGVQKSSGAGAGGSTSAPKMTYRNEDISKPLQSIMNILKMFGDLDEQEARVNNLNVAAATNQALADSEINYKEHMLEKMGLESDFIKSSTLLNNTRADNEKRKTFAEISAAKAYEELHVSQKRQVDAETKIMNDQADSKLTLIKEQAKAAATNNQYLADALRLSNEISEKERDKMEADKNLVIQKYDHLSRSQKLEVAERYYNLLYAASNNVSIGTNPVDKTGANIGIGVGGFNLHGGFDKSHTGGSSVNLNDFVKELAPTLFY